MTREEQAFNKIQILINENREMQVYMSNILNEKERLNYYYMDNPNCSAKKLGQEMRKLERLYQKHRANIAKNEREILKLRNRYHI